MGLAISDDGIELDDKVSLDTGLVLAIHLGPRYQEMAAAVTAQDGILPKRGDFDFNDTVTNADDTPFMPRFIGTIPDDVNAAETIVKTLRFEINRIE